ncbi:hypothetical protein PCIT_a0265 [Pseudoalteromonas citrea]|uniref:Uncharacterized protein n=1 Tax=Pseudoalteromonas citrea TaxID=43655 RepID=A0AAD4FSU5_9GAMM|nr:hypothetical protein PCIT_a0265 [Pseudoalteromonas citrea]
MLLAHLYNHFYKFSHILRQYSYKIPNIGICYGFCYFIGAIMASSMCFIVSSLA